MDRSPLLSVVVICWNSLERLRQLLDSVPDALAGIPHELILIDNGSTDGTADYIASFHPEIIYRRLGSNRGVAAARNRGIALAKGDYIWLIDDDTVINSEAVGAMLRHMEANPQCGICGCAHSVAYAEAVERAQGIHVPPRAQYIRAIMLEVERLHSHLLNIGLASHYTGFDSGFQQFFRVREKSMDLAEKLSGHRKTYGLNVIGGVRRDILAEQKLSTLTTIHQLRSEVQELVDVLLSTPNFIERTSGIGVLDRKIARDFSPVGPLMRGSGYARDVRFDHPFDGYADPDVQKMHAATADTCDAFGRTAVRIQEVYDSIDMIETMLENCPSGPILTTDWEYTPHKYAIGATEAPRGEDVHWAMLGNNQKCYRWRAKAATYSNWPVLRYMFRGNTVGDAALIVGSLDPCYSCTDRVTVTDVAAKRDHVLDKEQFENVWRDKSPLAGEGTMAAPLDEEAL